MYGHNDFHDTDDIAFMRFYIVSIGVYPLTNYNLSGTPYAIQ